MTCPPELATILLDLIQTAALRIRAAGWRGDAAACANEADHIHNLPALLRDYSAVRLKYYWEAERPSYLAHHGDAGAFQSIWDQLQQWLVVTKQGIDLKAGGPVTYRYLGPRKPSYRQLFVLGRGLRAQTLWSETLGEDAKTPEQVADNYNVPVEAVHEAIHYCEHNQDVLQQDWEDEEEHYQANRHLFPKPPAA